MPQFVIKCDNCGNELFGRFNSPTTFACQKCGCVTGTFRFLRETKDNALIFRCNFCENKFIVKAGEQIILQCAGDKCGKRIFVVEGSMSFSKITKKVIEDGSSEKEEFIEEIEKEDKTDYQSIQPLVLNTKQFQVNSIRAEKAKIKIAIPYYKNGERIDRAIKTWIYPETVFVITDETTIPPGWGVCHQIFTPKNAMLEGITKKTQPFIVDVLKRMLFYFPNCDYYGFFNSDIILPSGHTIESLLPSKGKKAVFHHRWELEGKDSDKIYDLKGHKQTCVGKDGFIASRETVQFIIDTVRDMVVGSPTWDDGMLVWLWKKYGVEAIELRYGEIYHVIHQQEWNINDKGSSYNDKQWIETGLPSMERTSVNWYKVFSSEDKGNKKIVGIIQPGRIGDIVLVLPIAKWYHDLGYHVIWPVIKDYVPLFDYVPYVEVIPIKNNLATSYRDSLEVMKERNIDFVIDLGIGFGRDEKDWISSNLPFDKWKYFFAQVPFEERFNLQINRNFQKELDLERKLELCFSENDYSFTHSVGTKGKIDFEVEGRTIEFQQIEGFTVWDWLGIIEKAKWVYCCDSCFSHIVNQLGIAKGKRTFSYFPIEAYSGRPLHHSCINWEREKDDLKKTKNVRADKVDKVLFVSLSDKVFTGNVPLYPLGIGYLVSSLKRDREALAIHFQTEEHSDELLSKFLLESNPDVVGFTCTSFNRRIVRKAIQKTRDVLPNAKVIVGGVHASFLYEHMLRHYGADYVVIGEGENTIRFLCRAIEGMLDLKEVRGIAYRQGEEIIVTDPVIPISNLDDLPLPDYSFVADLIRKSKMGSIITSRGCPARCNYCSTSHYWGQKIRTYSVDRVLDEIQYLKNEYGIKKLFFHDDTFNLTEKRVMDICQGMIDRKFNLQWACHGRVYPTSQEMIDKMVEAGCSHVCWGIESGSTSMLKSMNKKISFDQVKKTYKLCSKHNNLSTGAFTMVGFPGESEETIKETCEALSQISLTDDPSTSVLYVLPGTKVYEDLKIDNDFWLKDEGMLYNTTEHSLETLHKWAHKINGCGRRIPFDRSKHFWNNILFGKIPSPQPSQTVEFKKKSNQPIHFFTIVLNGMPFIKYHINLFKTLPYDWHWHIIEGVADLKFDTQWSIALGGKVIPSLHKNGLSKDGTTEYLDLLKKWYPDNVSIYRLKKGKFWDGKVEMVNAPIPNLPSECILWEIDVDELWDLRSVCLMMDLFKAFPEKMAAFIFCHYFVGPKRYVTDLDTWSTMPEDWIRVFRYRKGFHWRRHEPPTLVDNNGVDWGRKYAFSRDETLEAGISFQHFAYTIEEQLAFKETYYGYKDAVKEWKRVQKEKGNVNIANFLSWVKQPEVITDIWDEKEKGLLLFPGRWML